MYQVSKRLAGLSLLFLTFLGFTQESNPPINTHLPNEQAVDVISPVTSPVTVIPVNTVEEAATCHNLTVQLNYLLHIALTSKAVLQINTGNTAPCKLANIFYPQQQRYQLEGQQIPLRINITCALGTTVSFTVLEEQGGIAVFSALESCDTLVSDNSVNSSSVLSNQDKDLSVFPVEIMLNPQMP